MRLRPAPFIILLALLVTACGSSTASPPATAAPTLVTSVWMDFPVITPDYPQGATVLVRDADMNPVSGATVTGELTTEAGTQRILFPVTDADGLTHTASIPLPPVTRPTAYIITVTATRMNDAGWGVANATFEARP